MAKYAVLKKFYNSDPWRTLRLNLINERGNKCQRCKKRIPKARDIIGHHTIELTPENVHDTMISLNPELIEIVCFDCHNKEHNRFGYQEKKEREVFLVYGPPMSGKSTFVRNNMRPGDIVVDMDSLYEAVSYLPEYEKPNNLYHNVAGLQNLLLDNIKTRFGKWGDAWVIGGYPDKFKRNKVASDLGAELIFMDLTQEECLLRLEADEQRMSRIDEWKGYIEKWFDTYTE